MDNTLYIWLGIFLAIALAGVDDNTKMGFRWVALLLLGVLMIVYYL